ncbi:patatin-like phospholipase family protein [Parendozoicomonas sp. Alg238-R29]|uniref:patatin-like phospholipase family protein n=1 Tax=Parendozoicomonas sp. Alg238-R29 TaxID=2993446 RepID=UPI00248DDA90|nr:patatin-like phospholipase family protein [Parendozoicomonas sp. Alg238-R29]
MTQIRKKFRSLVIRGGHNAAKHLAEHGFQQQHVKAMLGASGGPKWFVLSGLDKALLGETFKERTDPLHLLGSSAGCWRFTCYSTAAPVAAIHRFQEAYIADSYEKRPAAAEVTRHVKGILKEILGDNGPAEILNNPVFRLNLVVDQGHGPLAFQNTALQMMGLMAASVGNAVHQKLLGALFSRVLFQHPSGGFPFGSLNDLPTRSVKLAEDNVADAVLASGSIPMVLEGVKDIAGAGKGLYLDGGVTDYHFNLPLTVDDGLVLYPHFREQPVPGWFDKGLPWRKPDAENYRRTLIVAPSAEFVSKLPYGKIPDRKDFTKLDTESRQKYWRIAVQESERLGDEWLELVEKQLLSEVLQPLTF